MIQPATARSFYNTDCALAAYLDRRWPVAIWTAVLKQAVADILDGPSLAETRDMGMEERREFGLALRAAAEHWVEDDGEDPRRFCWVCLQLGLEPSAVRRSIAERRNPL